jgi:hypothetical protein
MKRVIVILISLFSAVMLRAQEMDIHFGAQLVVSTGQSAGLDFDMDIGNIMVGFSFYLDSGTIIDKGKEYSLSGPDGNGGSDSYNFMLGYVIKAANNIRIRPCAIGGMLKFPTDGDESNLNEKTFINYGAKLIASKGWFALSLGISRLERIQIGVGLLF